MSDATTVTIETEPTAEWLRGRLAELVALLPRSQLLAQRWFADKGRAVKGLTLRDAVPLNASPALTLALVDVEFAYGGAGTYLLPLGLRPVDAPAPLALPSNLLCLRLMTPSGAFWLYDAAGDPDCARALFDLLAVGASVSGQHGRLVCHRTAALPAGARAAVARPLGAEQSNTSLVVDSSWVLKLYRHPPDGANPDVELPLYLTTQAAFAHTPALGAYAEYDSADYRPTLLALTAYLPNEGDGWSRALTALRRLAAGEPTGSPAREIEAGTAADLADITLLGAVTAELHATLAAAQAPALRPEKVSAGDVDAWLVHMRSRLRATLAGARATAADSPRPLANELQRLAAGEETLLARLEGLRAASDTSLVKSRHHGDYHLGQVLRTASGFAIVDFEGEPARPLAERRAKHLALRDVAGMLRSFDYAAGAVAREFAGRGTEPSPLFVAWAQAASTAFLAAYRPRVADLPLLPADPQAEESILTALLLDKAIYELGYELANRPDWVGLPLRYLLGLVPHD